ncbi:class I SAM-dependent methyltransferase [Limibaculum sp. M0105]|uniref:Class I SAM-dependent methyltransferase n=1 Tax=Thermohalobaculum xanthum TaxID=2753746 RepID=A0A8J7MB00_9RHOB|nr:class I SAM-dependent methyltransferase [Thermohalobaculum xanthum]MBK0401070.1 class I SAM-dependent methyltransferase [Thermohalobaculum xanthum]
MSSSDDGKKDAGGSLEAAYALKTPQDSVRLYGEWARDYDRDFAESHGYIYPAEVAALFRARMTDRNVPVLDIGAGTGLVAAALPGIPIDGVDISAEMLEVAGAKGLYRKRIVADLTRPLPMPDRDYGGFISTGTFTHGHVGPGCLPELMRVAAPGALFALGIKEEAFDEAGFGSAFATLVAKEVITPVDFVLVPVYRGADHEHADAQGLVAIFRRRESAPPAS